jgi:parallel beta-helix repeat protein
MHPTRSFTFSCLALVMLLGFGGQAFAVNYNAVGTCTPPNPPTHVYATIQAAVTASAPGTIIEICPGTYPEQVVITRKLTLEGVAVGGQDAVVILPPAGGLVQNTVDFDSTNPPNSPVAAQVLVKGPFVAAVTITNLTVDGTGNGIAACSPDVQGILFQNASGTLNHVAVRNQTLPPADNGCQSGESIYVQTAAGFSSTVTVANSSVHNYNKNGITGNDSGTKLTVTGSYVQGSGVVPVPGAAQNGVQLAYGAKGKISGNTVIDNIYGDPTVAASTDILLYDTAESSAITVSSNIVGNSQIPIAVYTDTTSLGDGVSVTGNKVFGTSTYDGIDVCTNGNTVTGNTVFNSAESGVHLDASCGGTGNTNIVTGNTILESECAGILDDTGTNTINSDTYYTVPFPVASSTAGCPFVAGPARAKTTSKFSPAR